MGTRTQGDRRERESRHRSKVSGGRRTQEPQAQAPPPFERSPSQQISNQATPQGKDHGKEFRKSPRCPTVMICTITSPNGGVFSVWIDGFNTSSNVDTFAHPGNISLPLCYPLQFPPFAVTPPGFDTRTNHMVTLIYTGPSIYSSEGSSTSTAQFDSFAIPDLHSHLKATNGNPPTHVQKLYFLLSLMLIISPLFVVL